MSDEIEWKAAERFYHGMGIGPIADHYTGKRNGIRVASITGRVREEDSPDMEWTAFIEMGGLGLGDEGAYEQFWSPDDAKAWVADRLQGKVEKLKANWESDPCWDIELTEGFEAWRDELKAFSDAQFAEREARRLEKIRKETEDVQEKASELGCSVDVMRYILALEARVFQLEERVDRLLEHSPDANRDLLSLHAWR